MSNKILPSFLNLSCCSVLWVMTTGVGISAVTRLAVGGSPGSVAIRGSGDRMWTIRAGPRPSHQSPEYGKSTGTQGARQTIVTVAQKPRNLTQSIINFLPRLGKIRSILVLVVLRWSPVSMPVMAHPSMIHDARIASDIWNPIFNTTNRSLETSFSPHKMI